MHAKDVCMAFDMARKQTDTVDKVKEAFAHILNHHITE